MDRQAAESLADARGQTCVAANVAGRECWLMVDCESTTLDRLAQCLSTDDWEKWAAGQMAAYDSAGNLLVDDESVEYEWPAVAQPIEFRRMSWFVAVVSGMGRAKLVSRHKSQTSAIWGQEKRKHETTRIAFLPADSEIGDEVLV